jgi:hypothetical protein
MISVHTMKNRSEQMIGEAFPLVMQRGRGHVVASDPAGLSLLVAGTRVQCTWERLDSTWQRLAANQTLSVDELGGGADAIGIVSFFASLREEGIDVRDAEGLLVVRGRKDTPVHQYADTGRLTTWAPWRRKRRAG